MLPFLEGHQKIQNKMVDCFTSSFFEKPQEYNLLKFHFRNLTLQMRLL